MERKTKLRTYKKLKTKLEREEYLMEDDVTLRRRLTQLRGGTNELRIEEGRWRRERLEDRVCLVCGSGKVEDERHFVLECAAYEELREKLFDEIYVLTEGQYNMGLMIDDQEWMLDALIGHGVSNKLKSRRVVMRFIKGAMIIRSRYIIQS